MNDSQKYSTIVRILVILFFNAFHTISYTQQNDFLHSEIDSIVKDIFAEHKVPGAIVTVVKNGKIIHNQGYGVSDLENNKAVDPIKTKFRVASITKTFTALAILDLVDRNILDLHEDIETYIKEDGIAYNFKYKVTLHDILTHSAGIEYTSFRHSQSAIDRGDLKTFAKTSIPNQVYPPGEVFSYSNHAYSILGFLIEKYNNERYEDYMDSFIKDKLGMINSTFHQHTDSNPQPYISHAYQWEDDQYIKQERQFVLNPSASTLNSTGRDMARFMTAMIDSNSIAQEHLIKKNSYQEMMKYQYKPPVQDGMGYGIFIEDYKGHLAYNHGGGIRGFVSSYKIIPSLNVGVFVSQNTRYGSELFMWNTRSQILDLITSEIEKPTKEVGEVPLDIMDYEGVYQQYTVNQSTFEKAQRIFGLREIRVKRQDNTLYLDNNEYAPNADGSFSVVGDQRAWDAGFYKSKDAKSLYLSQGLFMTFIRIPWYKRIIVIQVILGIWFLLMVFSVIVRPIWMRFKMKKQLTLRNLPQLWLWFVSTLLFIGFLILIAMYFFDVEINTGTPIGFKTGLIIMTLGASLLLFTPFMIWKKWHTTDRKNDTLVFTGIVLFLWVSCIYFWELNLIGLCYY